MKVSLLQKQTFEVSGARSRCTAALRESDSLTAAAARHVVLSLKQHVGQRDFDLCSLRVPCRSVLSRGVNKLIHHFIVDRVTADSIASQYPLSKGANPMQSAARGFAGFQTDRFLL
jgi:hypothetical protein